MSPHTKLRAVAGTIALLGCTPNLSPPEFTVEPAAPPSTLADFEQRCLDGDAGACTTASELYTLGKSELYCDAWELQRALDLRVRACALGDLDACYLAGDQEQRLGRIERAHERWTDACARGNGRSCDALLAVEVEQALDQNGALRRCAKLVDPSYSDSEVTLRMTLQNRGDRSELDLDPMPGFAILKACVREALEPMTFARTTARSGVRLDHELKIRRGLAAELFADEPSPASEPSPDACGGERRGSCSSLSIDGMMDNALYTPDASAGALANIASFDAPSRLEVTLEFCVDPETGRIARVRRSHPGPGQAIVDHLIAQVARWRFHPFERGGKPILACSQIDFEVDVAYPGIDIEEPPGPAVPGLAWSPAEPIYTPDPPLAALLRTKSAEAGDRRGTNTTSYCVDTSGRTVDVKTRSRFGDPEVDRIIRATMSSWRFRPAIVGGERVKICAAQTFRVNFERRVAGF